LKKVVNPIVQQRVCLMVDPWTIHFPPCATCRLSVKYSLVRVIYHVSTDRSLWVRLSVTYVYQAVCLYAKKFPQGSLCKMFECTGTNAFVRNSCSNNEGSRQSFNAMYMESSKVLYPCKVHKTCLSQSSAPIQWVRLSVCLSVWLCLSNVIVCQLIIYSDLSESSQKFRVLSVSKTLEQFSALRDKGTDCICRLPSVDNAMRAWKAGQSVVSVWDVRVTFFISQSQCHIPRTHHALPSLPGSHHIVEREELASHRRQEVQDSVCVWYGMMLHSRAVFDGCWAQSNASTNNILVNTALLCNWRRVQFINHRINTHDCHICLLYMIVCNYTWLSVQYI